MIRDLGIIPPGTTLYIPFHTFDSNDPSASVTLSGLATSDIEIYKDGGTTQRASDAGFDLLDTDGIDFDGITGIHGLSINLANNDTTGFYAAGSQYWVVVSSVTVDAATINFILCTFRIGYPDSVLNTTIATLTNQTSFTLTAGPAEDDALNGCRVLIHDVASAVQKGFAVVSDYTGASKTVTLVAATTFTVAATDNISFYPPIASTQLTTIASDLVQVYSDTTIATSKTTQIYSDTAITSSKAVQIYSDSTAIHSDTTAIHSDTTAIHSDTTITSSKAVQVYSDTTMIASKATQIYSDTTLIAADGPNTPTKGVELADVLLFMVDESDYATPETGVTLTVTISKDGGAFAACTNSASEISGGWYKITLTAAEMGADSIAIKATGTGCAQRNLHFRTQPT